MTHPETPLPHPKKVILDTDPGVDDALALLLAFRSPELSIVGITTVCGNVPVEQGCVNVFRILDLLGLQEEPPVARGAERPLRGAPEGAEGVHGPDGLGGIDEGRYPPPRLRLSSLSAEELILQLVRDHPGKITLITLGPLTNLAQILLRNRAALEGLNEVIVMGGAVTVPGNVTPYAEFNIIVDPEAAQVVLEAGLPLTLVGLDVTHQVILPRRTVEAMARTHPHPRARFLLDCTGHYMDFHEKHDRIDGCYLHDPLAVGVAIQPSLVKTRDGFLTVDTHQGPMRGRITERSSILEGPQPAPVQVCVTVEADRFLALFLERLYL
ncbi:MAG: nucleoside hydrolase [Candidatus Tectomicrobia bacterium]|uniref:Nucleoside hydrolase n=1 Tax=Tectimicrobiota bacterium TaxID=2528274 RepID=A0A932CMA7_UNCTE|nr:nucleoside hydrolase [Candidatus Tectomicrobia bacterium]